MLSLLEACQGAPLAEFPAGEVVRRNTQVASVEDPGALFVEMSVLLSRPHAATVRTLRPCSLYVFDDAASFLRSNPEVAYHVARLIAGRLNAATSYLADIKQQFEDRTDHLGRVGEVLDTLMHNQEEEFKPGPERETGSRL